MNSSRSRSIPLCCETTSATKVGLSVRTDKVSAASPYVAKLPLQLGESARAAGLPDRVASPHVAKLPLQPQSRKVCSNRPIVLLHPSMPRNYLCNSLSEGDPGTAVAGCISRCCETTSATGPATLCSFARAGQSEGSELRNLGRVGAPTHDSSRCAEHGRMGCARPTGGSHTRTVRAPAQRRGAQGEGRAAAWDNPARPGGSIKAGARKPRPDPRS
jgi:hypothetical protein